MKAKFIIPWLNGQPALSDSMRDYCLFNGVGYYSENLLEHTMPDNKAELIITTPNEQVMNEIKALPEFEFIEDLEVLE